MYDYWALAPELTIFRHYHFDQRCEWNSVVDYFLFYFLITFYEFGWAPENVFKRFPSGQRSPTINVLQTLVCTQGLLETLKLRHVRLPTQVSGKLRVSSLVSLCVYVKSFQSIGISLIQPSSPLPWQLLVHCPFPNFPLLKPLFFSPLD